MVIGDSLQAVRRELAFERADRQGDQSTIGWLISGYSLVWGAKTRFRL